MQQTIRQSCGCTRWAEIMSTHLALDAPPISSIRQIELAATGLPARRSRKRDEFRTEIRALLSRSAGKHRVTFVPVGTYAGHLD